MRDIIDTLEARKTLTSTERFLKAIIDTNPECIKILDSDGNLMMMNPAGLAMIEADSFEQVKGQCVFNLVTGPYRDKFIALTKQIFKGVPGTLEFETVGLKGRHVWLDTHAVPFRNDQGKIVALLGITRDVTEQKRLAEERITLETQFQQAQRLESLGILAGGIAHDFNNLLAVIIGNCALAKLKPMEVGEKISSIETAANRAAEICQQMLAYAGKSNSIKGPTQLDELVEEMIRMAKFTLAKNVSIRSELAFGTTLVLADASQLRQVTMNLIINAAEAIGDVQGEVRVSLTKKTIRADQLEHDHFGAPIPPGGYVCLQVADNGCGMDVETQKRIFEPFFTSKFTGRGLGMAAVLGIIKGHNGAVQISSQLGQGTNFKIFVPIQIIKPSADQSSQSPTATESWQGKGTILLVEDEEQVSCVVEEMLGELGFSVLNAANGQVALEVYQRNAKDITLVITDCGMPVMDGYTLFKKLKILNPKLPIIMSSGFGANIVSARISLGDMTGLISKPYDFIQLRDLLKRVVK